MTYPLAQLKRLTEDSTVEILPDPDAGITGGSGFFVAPGLAVTCAHVVARGGEVRARRVAIRWRGSHYEGSLRARPTAHGTSLVWAYPDICVIELDRRPPGQPQVLLGDLPEAGAELYFFGFSRIYDPAVSRCEAQPGRQGGHRDIDGGRVWQLAGAEMAAGVSGGPVLDLRAGVVCAVAKSQRMPDSDMGGLIIPAAAIRDYFPQVWERNQRDRPPGDDWPLLRQAVREVTDPLSALLPPESRQHLIGLAAGLGLGRRDFSQLYQDIAGDLSPPPPARLNSVTDLAAALANLNEDGLNPVVELLDELQRRRASDDDHAADLAARLGQGRELRRYRHRERQQRDQRSEDARPVIVVRLDANTPRRGEVLLDIWSYRSRTGRARLVDCEPGPHTIRRAEKIVLDVLAREIDLLPAHRPVLIEFALPHWMLDTAVETWALDMLPLGDSHAVVIRSADRTPKQQAWRSRSEKFRSERLPAKGAPEWGDLWVDCTDRRTIVQLNGMMQDDTRLPVVALTSWGHGRALPAAARVALLSGAPVIVWQHKRCPDHRQAAANGMAAACRGARFRAAVSDSLADVPLYDLPEQIWQERARMARDGGSASPSHGIAILWDDPDRVPWRDAPANRDPSQSVTTGSS